MKMKVKIDKAMRIVSKLTVRLEFSRSVIMLNMLAARLSTISPSRTAMMIFTINMEFQLLTRRISVLDQRAMSR
jgi:hypothetical protein